MAKVSDSRTGSSYKEINPVPEAAQNYYSSRGHYIWLN